MKNKKIYLIPFAVLLISLSFAMTIIPVVQPKPNNMPIAILNLDKDINIEDGIEINLSGSLIDKIKETTESQDGSNDPIRWIELNDKKKTLEDFNSKDYYGVMVIPEDYTLKQLNSFSGKYDSIKIDIYINQGSNYNASIITKEILNNTIETIRNEYKKEVLKNYEKSGEMISYQDYEKIDNLIIKEEFIINKIKDNTSNGNSPMLIFQSIWVSSLMFVSIFYIYKNKLKIKKYKINLLILSMITSILISIIYTYFVSEIINLEIGNYLSMSLLIFISTMAFILLISSFVDLIGIIGIPLFGFLLFFGTPLMSLTPELMPNFYRYYVDTWFPTRFMIEAIKEITFYDKVFLELSTVKNLIYIIIGSLILFLIPKKNKNSQK